MMVYQIIKGFMHKSNFSDQLCKARIKIKNIVKKAVNEVV